MIQCQEITTNHKNSERPQKIWSYILYGIIPTPYTHTLNISYSSTHSYPNVSYPKHTTFHTHTLMYRTLSHTHTLMYQTKYGIKLGRRDKNEGRNFTVVPTKQEY